MPLNKSKLKHRCLIFCLLALLIVGGSQWTIAQTDSPISGQSTRVIVMLNTPSIPEDLLESTSAIMQQRQSISNIQDRVLQRIQTRASQPVIARRATTLPIMGLTVDADGLAQLQADPDVVSIMPDELYAPTQTDPLTIINAPEAWDLGFDGSGYAIAILDTGVDFSHPAMAGKRVAEACFSDLTCPNGQYEQYGTGAAQPASCDGCEHGTHVAGIAAGNTTGFSGVAPGAGIIAINVFTTFDDSAFCSYYGYSSPCVLSYTIDQLLALDHVYTLSATYNIASINMSLGGGHYTSVSECDYISAQNDGTSLFLLYGDLLRERGIPIIAASGNNGYKDGGMGRPACYSNVISVGASTLSDGVPSWSNTTDYLDLLAPGESIYSSIPGGEYAYMSGTSMATPFVAGAWAVAREAYPTYTVDEILAMMRDTGTDVSESGIYVNSAYSFTTPRLNIYETVLQATPPDYLLNMQQFLAYLQESASSTDLEVILVRQSDRALETYISVNGEVGRVFFTINNDNGLLLFSYGNIVNQSDGAPSAVFEQTVTEQFPDLLTTALNTWLDQVMPGESTELMLLLDSTIKVWKE